MSLKLALFANAWVQQLALSTLMLILYALTHGFLDSVVVDEILRYQDEMFDFFDNNHKDLLDHIAKTGQLPDTDKLDTAIKEFAASFQANSK